MKSMLPPDRPFGESRTLYSVAYGVALLSCVALSRALATLAGIHPGGSVALFWGVAIVAVLVLCGGLLGRCSILHPLPPCIVRRFRAAPDFTCAGSRHVLFSGHLS